MMIVARARWDGLMAVRHVVRSVRYDSGDRATRAEHHAERNIWAGRV